MFVKMIENKSSDNRQENQYSTFLNTHVLAEL